MYELEAIRNDEVVFDFRSTFVNPVFYRSGDCVREDLITLMAKTLLDDGTAMTEEEVRSELDDTLDKHIRDHNDEKGEAELIYIETWDDCKLIIDMLGIEEYDLWDFVLAVKKKYREEESSPCSISFASVILITLFDMLKRDVGEIIRRAKEICRNRFEATLKNQFPDESDD